MSRDIPACIDELNRYLDECRKGSPEMARHLGSAKVAVELIEQVKDEQMCVIMALLATGQFMSAMNRISVYALRQQKGDRGIAADIDASPKTGTDAKEATPDEAETIGGTTDTTDAAPEGDTAETETPTRRRRRF